MALKLKISTFCHLVYSKPFLQWLSGIDTDLHKLLIDRKPTGCKGNREIMLKVHAELYARNKGDEFEVFIKERYPHVIDNNDLVKHTKKQARAVIPPPTPVIEQTKQVFANDPNLNKHGIFPAYNPQVLMFPHRRIIAGQPNTLQSAIEEFSKKKQILDWIIIEDRAYVEWISAKYVGILDKIPEHQYCIRKYKQSQTSG